MKTEFKGKWYVWTAHTHTRRRLIEYLQNNLLNDETESFMLDNGEEHQGFVISEPVVIRIGSDKDMHPHVAFYFKKYKDKLPVAVSNKDALALLTGQIVSDKKVALLYDLQAKEAFARKVVLKAKSLMDAWKKKNRDKYDSLPVEPLHEYYEKKPRTIADLKGQDRVTANFLKKEFSNVSLSQPRKNIYIDVQ